MDGFADILNGGVAQNGNLASVRIHLNIGDVNSESTASLLRCHCNPRADVNAAMSQRLGQFRQTDPFGTVCLIAAFATPAACYLGDLLFLCVDKHTILEKHARRFHLPKLSSLLNELTPQ